MAYVSISGRPGNLSDAPCTYPDGSKGFAVDMRDGVLVHLTFDKETARQWAAVLTKEFEGEQ